MDIYTKIVYFSGQKALISLAMMVIYLVGMPIFNVFSQNNEIDLSLVSLSIIDNNNEERLALLQENSLLAIANPSNPEPKVVRQLLVVATAYSSTVWQTDETPHITAAGTWVRDGIIANNILPFGTKIRLPELYGEKVFVVEDRMSWKKSNYQIDIWFPDYWQAKQFGAKTTFIEILES